jgi:hypothetical protein
MSSTAVFRSMIVPVLGLALEICIGCAGQRFDAAPSSDLQIRAAIEERDAAAAEVAKVVGRYCSLRSDSVEARQRCLIGQQVEIQFMAPVEAGNRFEQPHMESEGRQIMQCEDAQQSTLCRRRPPAYVELWDSEPVKSLRRHRIQ